jgi:hypothetical protein
MDAKAINTGTAQGQTKEKAAAEPVRTGFWGKMDSIPDFPYTIMVLAIMATPIAIISLILKMLGF